MTTITSPVETHSPVDSLPNSRRMRAAQPSRCVCPTVMLWNTGSGHHCSRCSSEPVPFGYRQVALVTSQDVAPMNTCSSCSVVEHLVISTTIVTFRAIKENKALNIFSENNSQNCAVIVKSSKNQTKKKTKKQTKSK